MKCWYDLRIDVTGCFLPTFKFPTPVGNYGIWHPQASEVFHPQWLKYMSKLGVPLYTVMIFYRGPFSGTEHAHVDVAKADPFSLTPWGINWVYGGKNSSMVWYEQQEIKTEDINYTAAKTPYVYWYVNNLKEIERKELTQGKVTLVRTDFPHSIEMDLEPRWCFSARTSIPDEEKWENITKIFRNKNLLIER